MGGPGDTKDKGKRMKAKVKAKKGSPPRPLKMSKSGRIISAIHAGMIPHQDGKANKKCIFRAEARRKTVFSFAMAGILDEGNGRKKAQ